MLVEHFELINSLFIPRCHSEMLAVLSNKPRRTRAFEIINTKFVKCQLPIKRQRHRLTDLTQNIGCANPSCLAN